MPYKDPEKRREASRRWYLRNQKEQVRRVMARSKRIRGEVYKHKEENPCTDCGKKYPHYVMEFDHVRGEKLANVGDLLNRNMTISGVWGEIAKCELVCANCHRYRTHSRRAAKKATQQQQKGTDA
jgi:hypothetical protein